MSQVNAQARDVRIVSIMPICGQRSTQAIPPNGIVGVVDDDAAVRCSLKFSLELEGFVVRLYSGGGELLEAPDVDGCGCLVIDQNMPGLSGLDTLSRLRARHVTVPVILITGHPSRTLHARAREAGVNIVEKPLFGDALVDRIRGAMQH